MASSMSASGKMMLGDLPPSSRVTRLRLWVGAVRMMSYPTSVDPVKAILFTPGCSTSGAPAVGPNPGSTLTTPGGMPASRASSPTRSAVSGVCSAGLSTEVHPAASAGPSFHVCIRMGKFLWTGASARDHAPRWHAAWATHHGVIWPVTPTGSCRV